MRLARVAASAGVVAIAAAGPCAAAGSSPTLALRGGRAGPAGTACGVHATWRYYRRGSTLAYRGRVRAASSATVRVVVERCYPGGFRVIDAQHPRLHGGRYGDAFVVHVRSDCFVQALYAGARSRRAYFRVR